MRATRFALGAVAAATLLVFHRPESSADEPREPSAGLIVLPNCTLECDQTTLLCSRVSSILQDRLVRLGDHVKAGQVLGRLFNEDARADKEIFAAEAESDIQVRICKTELSQALQKLKKTEALSRRQFVSTEELLIDRFAVQRAEMAVEEADQRRRIAQIKRRLADAELHSRDFVSPHDGVVVGAFKNQGESVAQHEPVFKVVNTARLKVWGALNVADLGKVQVNQEVQVRAEVAGSDLAFERETFPGRITFIDAQIDEETQTCKVLAEVDNPAGTLRAGLKANMAILPREPTRAAGAQPKPRIAPRPDNAAAGRAPTS